MSFEVVKPSAFKPPVLDNAIEITRVQARNGRRMLRLKLGAGVARHLGLVRGAADRDRILEIAWGRGSDIGKLRLATADGAGYRMGVYGNGTASTMVPLPEDLAGAPDGGKTMTPELLKSERTGQPYVICALPAGYVDPELARAARAET